jgi:hypothetical protein
MTLAETDAAAGVLRAKRAQRVRKRAGGAALANPTAREFLRRLLPSGRPAGRKFQQRIDMGERAWSGAKPTQPKGDPP